MNLNFKITTINIVYINCCQSGLPKLLAVYILYFSFFLNPGVSELEEDLKPKSFW